MSDIAGLFYFDLRPVREEDTSLARACLGGHGPHLFGPETFRAPGLVMVSSPRICETRPELPTVCHWDGRLDNRGDLMAAYGVEEPDDRSLVSAAYAAEGLAGFRHLVGDWSLALWDGREHRLYLASDYAGVRPLYFHQTAERLLWSSSLTRLANAVNAGSDPDEGYVADFLLSGSSAERTPYPGVFCVPAGHAVEASRVGVRIRLVRSLELTGTVRYSKESEYDEHFCSLFQESISARLGSGGTICAELSGGLDSTSVVSIAHHQISQSMEPANRLVPLSYCERGSIDAKFVAAAERGLNLPGVHIDLATDSFVSEDAVGGAQPGWWEPRLREVERRMRQIGSRVLLTGRLGDLAMGNWFEGSEQIGEAISQGRAGEALRLALDWSRAQRKSVYRVFWEGLRNSGTRGNSGAVTRQRNSGEFDSLTPAFRKRTERRQSGWLRDAAGGFAHPGSRERARSLAEVLSSRTLQRPEALKGIDYTHPFAHRPLLEFMLAIPPDVVYRPGEPRRLMRRALTGLVPEAILRRRTKAGYEASFRQSLLPLANKLLGDTKIGVVERGYVDPAGLRTRLERYVQGIECNEPQLRQIILLEFWLRRNSAALSLVRSKSA